MPTIFLYAIIVLIWGSTWSAITFQIGDVAEEVSVAYRFGLASISLFVYARATQRAISIPLHAYAPVIVMGTLMFSVSYLFVYHGTSYINSGLVAVTFSLLVVTNGIMERLFFGTKFERRLIFASLFGMLGVACMFWPEVSSFNMQDQTVVGLQLVIVSVLIASLGNMAAIVNTRRGLPVVAVNAHAMGWGALTSMLAAVAMGKSITFSTQPAYLWSLFYLSIFGSAVAFGAYLALIRRIGSVRTAYSSILFPIVALVISTFVENYQWSTLAVVGIALIATGNWLALTRIKAA